MVILFFAWGLFFFKAESKKYFKFQKQVLYFYFYALKVGNVLKVAPNDKLSLVLTIVLAALILKEKVTLPIYNWRFINDKGRLNNCFREIGLRFLLF